VDDEVSIPMSVPLDDDGFLRRECPTCEREFKCLVAQNEEESTPAPEGGYFCPYCAVQAPPDAWWTKAQVELAQATAYREVVAPELEKLQRDMDRMSRRGGLISMSMEISDEPQEPELSELNDMRRVDFHCHADDPVKVLENWERPVRCTICGAEAAAS
jgi:hypothetical protein